MMLILRVIAGMIYIIPLRLCMGSSSELIKGLYFMQVRPFIVAWCDSDSILTRFRSNSFSLGSFFSITGNTIATLLLPQTSN
jgi:hypothetical protein